MTSEKTPLRTFDMALQTRVNALSQVVHGEPLLPDFSPPRPYTGELFGVEFLRSQCGQARAEQDIDREIDEAFQEEDQSWNEADSVPEHQDDPTLALPDDGEVSTDEDTDRDSGNEVNFQSHSIACYFIPAAYYTFNIYVFILYAFGYHYRMRQLMQLVSRAGM